jgi:hypothetical protein
MEVYTMNMAQLIEQRAQHVLCGAVCVVAAITLGNSGFVAYIPSGFWRTSAALALVSGFAYGIHRAVFKDFDSFVEMGVRFATFLLLTLFLHIGVYRAL